MSQQKYFVIKKKVNVTKAHPVPESTYKPPSTRELPKSEPIRTTKFFEELSRPKEHNIDTSDEITIQKYQNPHPVFKEIDFRVTQSQLERDKFLMDQKRKYDESKSTHDGDKLIEWQKKYNEEDEKILKQEIEQRRQDVIHSRKNAIEAKKRYIQQQMDICKNIREETREKLKLVEIELEKDRAKIRELKALQVDNVPKALHKNYLANCAKTKEMIQTYRDNMKLIRKNNQEYMDNLRVKCNKLRDDVKNHRILRNHYVSKVEITERKFLDALTEEEANQLIKDNRAREHERISELIAKHRKAKEEKIQRMVELLREETEYREQQELAHEEKRRQIFEQREAEKQKLIAEEEKKYLELEKKLEMKRKLKLKEAEEAEERMRQISARNCFLALNKKTQAANCFTYKQNAALRTAKARQEDGVSFEPQRQETARKNKKSKELTNLRMLLGV